MALIIEMKKSKFFSKKKFLNFLNFKFLKKKHILRIKIFILLLKKEDNKPNNKSFKMTFIQFGFLYHLIDSCSYFSIRIPFRYIK